MLVAEESALIAKESALIAEHSALIAEHSVAPRRCHQGAPSRSLFPYQFEGALSMFRGCCRTPTTCPGAGSLREVQVPGQVTDPHDMPQGR